MTSTEFENFIRRSCPMCGSSEAHIVLELPSTPLGDRYSITASDATSLICYPLQVSRCDSCGHCYIPILTEPDESYQHYLFQSSQSPGLPDSFREIVEDLIIRHKLDYESLIIDIGANDGSWLSFFQSACHKLLAIEPAPHPALKAKERGLDVINDYFSASNVLSSGLLSQPPRIVSMNYMFANVPNPLSILKDIANISDVNTIISILTGYHPAQLSVGMFDYVYHEHLSYYTCQDFLNMANEAGLTVTYCRELPLKGGSLHIELSKTNNRQRHSTLFSTMLKRERWLDQPKDRQWLLTGELIREVGDKVKALLKEARANGQTVIGYGASHSTTTLCFSLGIDNLLDYIVDDNPAKHDRYSPKHAIPIKTPDNINDYHSPCVIILGWQHAPKIIEALSQRNFRGTVITPFPCFKVEEFS